MIARTLLRGWQARSVAAGLVIAAVVVHRSQVPTVSLPSLLTSRDTTTPIATLAAAVGAVALGLTLAEPISGVTRTAARRLGAWRASRTLAIGLLAAVGTCHGFTSLVVDAFPVWVFATEAVLTACLAKARYAWIPVLVHVAIAVEFGQRGDGTLLPWAVVLSRPDRWTAGVAAGAFVVTTIAWARRGAREPL